MAKPIQHAAWPLDDFLKKQKQTLQEFSSSRGIELKDIHAHKKNDLVIVNDNLYCRTTRYTDRDTPLKDQQKGILLEDHIKKAHNQSTTLFSQKHGESQNFVVFALKDQAMWINNEVFQLLPTMASWEATLLEKHVEEMCNGNTTAFSRVCKTTQQQMHRWVSRECYFSRNEIYLRRTNLNKSNKTPAHTKAVLLEEHIRIEFGPGDDGVLLFSQKNKLNPQQVKRYIGYESLWMLGDVYKNQSKFKENNISLDYSQVGAH